jgi:hypothetical protein
MAIPRRENFERSQLAIKFSERSFKVKETLEANLFIRVESSPSLALHVNLPSMGSSARPGVV